MLNRLILKVTKFQLPPPKRLGTVLKNILGAIMPPNMSNRVKTRFFLISEFLFGNSVAFSGLRKNLIHKDILVDKN